MRWGPRASNREAGVDAAGHSCRPPCAAGESEISGRTFHRHRPSAGHVNRDRGRGTGGQSRP